MALTAMAVNCSLGRSDRGEGDGRLAIRARILAADILIFGTPVWLGQPCGIAQRVTAAMVASNAAHLAGLLNDRPYPGSGE